MTAVIDQATTTATEEKKIEVFINLNPVMGLDLNAEDEHSPGAKAAYIRYGYRYLKAVEKFVTANNVPNLHLYGQCDLLADDDHFQVDVFAELTIQAGSETDQRMQKYHEVHGKAQSQPERDYAAELFGTHLAEHIAKMARDSGHHFRFSADYRW